MGSEMCIRDRARLITLKHGLKLEMKGMRVSRGRTCYSIVKEELGLRGNRQKVLDQLEEMLEIGGRDNA